jgi:tripartite-type tricarboxylate transporter receptor subunit TctC
MRALMRGLASTLVACLASSVAFAEDHLTCSEGFADERMTLVVPNAPGGGYDQLATTSKSRS